MNLSREDKFIVVCILIVIAVIVGCVLWNGYKDKQLIQETTKRVAAEERIKQDAKEYSSRAKVIDSLQIWSIKQEAIIEYQKKNPSIIIEKYEKEHATLDTISNSKSFELFSINIESYKANKDRYRLLRFK